MDSFENCNLNSDNDESEYGAYEESDENEDEIDSDIEAALYSQIHHLENPSYELTLEETENSQTKNYSKVKNNNGNQSLDSILNKDKDLFSSVITISDESDECNLDKSNSSDVEFICETKSKNKSGDDIANNCQKEWWEKFVSVTYNDGDDDRDISLENDKNVEYKRKKKLTKLRHSESSSLEYPGKNNTKQLSKSLATSNITISKRKRSDSTSSENNAFKHARHRKEDKDISINIKPSVTMDLTKDDNDLWKLCSKDIYKNREGSRYYNKQMRIICNNCSERGHISRNCKRPKKLPVCYLCGKVGHEGEYCLNPACRRCLAVGHNERQCKWKNIAIKQCPICNMWDHLKEECPNVWRRYHMTTSPGPIIIGNSSRNNIVFCYNCARKDHFGHECNMERMNPDIFPTSPFISHYSEPMAECVDFVTLYELDKINRHFSKLAKRKRKCIKSSNKQFEKESKFLHKKAERISKLALSSSSAKCKKSFNNEKKTLFQGTTRNETKLSLASSSQETSNVSKLDNIFCIPQRKKRKRKAKCLVQQTEIHQENQTKKYRKKKKKRSQTTVIKSEIIPEDNSRISNDNATNAVTRILRCLVPEVSLSMACMKLFSGKNFGNS